MLEVRIFADRTNDTANAHEAADRAGGERLQFVADDSGPRRKAGVRL